MSNENKNLLLWIQSLRGIAALLVVYTHARYSLPGATGQFVAQEIIRPAAMGVDLFFILSGFIMVLTTQDFDLSKRYAWTFMLKRFARIWPLYAAVSAYVFIFKPPVAAASFKTFVGSLLFIPTNLSTPLTFSMPVPVAWTLCFEFYFYVVFGVSLLFGRWRYAVLAAWFFATLVAYPVMAGTFSHHVLAQQPIHSFKYANLAVNPIVWDFIFGILAGWLYISKIKISNLPALRLFVLFSLAFVVWASYSGLVDMHGPAGWGGPLLLLMISLTLLGKVEQLSLPKWTVWLGGVSYSLYLTHLIAFGLVFRSVAMLGLHDPNKVGVGQFILAPAVAVVFAAVIYTWVENPLSTWARSALLNMKWGKKRDVDMVARGSSEGGTARL